MRAQLQVCKGICTCWGIYLKKTFSGGSVFEFVTARSTTGFGLCTLIIWTLIICCFLVEQVGNSGGPLVNLVSFSCP